MRQLPGDSRGVELTGKLFAVYVSGPGVGSFVLAELDSIKFLPIFSTVEKLNEGLRWMKVDTASIKQIDDGKEFLASLLEQFPTLRIMLDPWITERGTTRFTEITLAGAELN